MKLAQFNICMFPIVVVSKSLQWHTRYHRIGCHIHRNVCICKQIKQHFGKFSESRSELCACDVLTFHKYDLILWQIWGEKIQIKRKKTK